MNKLFSAIMIMAISALLGCAKTDAPSGAVSNRDSSSYICSFEGQVATGLPHKASSDGRSLVPVCMGSDKGLVIAYLSAL